MIRQLRARRHSLGVWFALLALVVFSAPLPAEDETSDELPWRFDITAMNVGGAGPRSARLELRITRWSTAEDQETLFRSLREGGSRALPGELNRQESVGRLREVRGTGQEFHYARRIPTEDGGQRIILATDRPLTFFEAWRSTRTTQYNVTIVQLDLDAEGRGDGSLMMGAEIGLDQNTNQIFITHASSQPIRLSRVRQQ